MTLERETWALDPNTNRWHWLTTTGIACGAPITPTEFRELQPGDHDNCPPCAGRYNRHREAAHELATARAHLEPTPATPTRPWAELVDESLRQKSIIHVAPGLWLSCGLRAHTQADAEALREDVLTQTGRQGRYSA